LRYIELLKQIPPGKEELPEVLLKKLDSAAFSLINNQAGQYDPTDEEREACNADNPDDFPEISDWHGKWGLLDRWPLKLGDLILYKSDESGVWYLEINSGSSCNLVLESGSKHEMLTEMESLDEYREAKGEEAFEAEIMRLVDHYQRVKYDRYGEYRS
jgi:hypothetical protein